MTTFMKIEAVTYFVLKVIGYLAGFIGAFAILGFTGACDRGHITLAQYIIYELQAFCLIGLSFIVYIIRERIKEDVIRRGRAMRRRAKRLALAQ